MDKKIAGLLGAVAGLATMSTAQAETNPAPNPAEVLHASSYADLLSPVSNAVALVRADDAARARQPAEGAGDVQVAQVYYPIPPNYHHHHHHHHHSYRRYARHHHHHHHHQHVVVGIPGVGGVVVGGR